MKNYSILLFVILFGVGCKKSLSDSNKDFDSNQWPKGKQVSLKIIVDKPMQNKKLNFRLSHVQGIQYPVLPLQIKKISPAGKVETKAFNLFLIDAQGQPLSDCSGDYCDIDTVIDSHLSLPETGEYRFEVTNSVDLPFVPGIMQVGVDIDD